MPIYHELKEPTVSRMAIIVTFSIGLTIFVYISIGVFGVLRFGDDTNPDVLLSYPTDCLYAVVGRIFIAFTSTFSYPMLFFTDRLSVQTLVYSVPTLRKYLFEKDNTLKTIPFLILSTILFFCTLVIALIVPDIVTVFGFIGSIGAVTLDFFLPSLLVYKILRLKKKVKMWQWILFGAYIILLQVVTFVMMFGGIGVTIFKIIVGDAE